jgi:hypothetical protein
VPGTQQQIVGHTFAGYGAHIDRLAALVCTARLQAHMCHSQVYNLLPAVQLPCALPDSSSSSGEVGVAAPAVSDTVWCRILVLSSCGHQSKGIDDDVLQNHRAQQRQMLTSSSISSKAATKSWLLRKVLVRQDSRARSAAR